MKINRGLFLDDVDKFIIKQIVSCYKNKFEMNTWALSKIYVSNLYSKKLEKVYADKKMEVDDIYRKIQMKIRNYTKHGLIIVSKNESGKNIYNFNMNLVTIAKHKFSDGYKECLIIRL
jgi:hypothetical protein